MFKLGGDGYAVVEVAEIPKARHWNPQRAVCITLGEQSENHAGMKMNGDGLAENGYSVGDLKAIKKRFEGMGGVAELVMLNEVVDRAVEPAGVLFLRGGVDILLGENGKHKDMFWEMTGFKWDSKYWDTRRSKVLNKHARYNVCFGDEGVAADFEAKKGTIIGYSQVPLMREWKDRVEEMCEEETPLQAEGNYYYDLAKCYIGFHGDSERKKVVACNLGADRVIHWQWYYDSKPFGDRIKFELRGGDVYIMSEKASGWDWKRRKICTLRHAAAHTHKSKILK